MGGVDVTKILFSPCLSFYRIVGFLFLFFLYNFVLFKGMGERPVHYPDTDRQSHGVSRSGIPVVHPPAQNSWYPRLGYRRKSRLTMSRALGSPAHNVTGESRIGRRPSNTINRVNLEDGTVLLSPESHMTPRTRSQGLFSLVPESLTHVPKQLTTSIDSRLPTPR